MAHKRERGGEKANGVLTIVGVVLCCLLLPVLIVNLCLLAKSVLNRDEVPDIGGVLPLIVLSDSMYPGIQSGDLIICNTLDASEVQVGDIIAFFDPEGNGTSVVTHRVVEITTQDGELAFVTKGDANNARDALPVPASSLVGRYRSRLPGVGRAAMFMQTTQGLIVCVLCPMVLLVVIDLVRRRRYERRHSQDTEALMEELRALREAQARQGQGQ